MNPNNPNALASLMAGMARANAVHKTENPEAIRLAQNKLLKIKDPRFDHTYEMPPESVAEKKMSSKWKIDRFKHFLK